MNPLPSTSLTSTAAPHAAEKVTPAAAKAAAQWLVRLHAGDMSETDRQACIRWRASHPEHEFAWQRAEQISRKFGLVPATLGAPTLRQAAQNNRRATLKTLTLMIAAGPVAWLTYRYPPWQEWMAQERTVTGERRQLVLTDGTQLTLNTDTTIDIAFDDTTRRVLLRSGEILIQTAPDRQTPARPFIVDSRHGSLRALGTRFVVRQQEQRSSVAVLQGAVEVTPRDNIDARYVVGANQQSSFNQQHGDGLQKLTPHADGWSSGALYVENMPLGEFIAEVARYRPGILRCDPAVTQLKVAGVFQLRDTDAILTALVESLPLRAAFVTRYWVTLLPA